jgi:hypothetical protein
LTLFDNEPTEEPSIVSANDFVETEIPNNFMETEIPNDFKEADLTNKKCEKTSDFKKYLAWKQTLDDLKKANKTKGE